jgi:hypothetical protein
MSYPDREGSRHVLVSPLAIVNSELDLADIKPARDYVPVMNIMKTFLVK